MLQSVSHDTDGRGLVHHGFPRRFPWLHHGPLVTGVGYCGRVDCDHDRDLDYDFDISHAALQLAIALQCPWPVESGLEARCTLKSNERHVRAHPIVSAICPGRRYLPHWGAFPHLMPLRLATSFRSHSAPTIQCAVVPGLVHAWA